MDIVVAFSSFVSVLCPAWPLSHFLSGNVMNTIGKLFSWIPKSKNLYTTTSGLFRSTAMLFQVMQEKRFTIPPESISCMEFK